MRKYILFLLFLCRAGAQSQPVVTMLPRDGTTGVPLNARIIAALGYPATYSLTPFKVTKGGAAVSGTTQLPECCFAISSPTGAFGWVAFTPDKPLDPNTVYKVEVDAPGPVFSSFTTGTAADATPLQLLSSSPSPGQDGVNAMGSLTLRFNKPLNPFSFKQGQFQVRDLTSGGPVTGGYFSPQMQSDGSTLLFPFTSPNDTGLTLGHAYQFEFPSSGITDWLGNPLSPVPGAIPFTTFRNPEKEGPVLVGSVPADGETNVAMNLSIVLVFDKPLAQIPYDGYVTLDSGGDSGGPVKFKLDNSVGGGRVLIVQPTLLMAPNSQVFLRVAGLLDAFGARLSAPIVIGFRTGIAPETKPLQLNPTPNVTLPETAAIQATFNRPIDPLLLSLGGIGLYPSGSYVNPAPVPYTVSTDHRTITLNPATPLPAGSYRALISIPYDRTAGKLNPFEIDFTVTGDIDTAPPQVLAVTPPDATSDAPLNALIQVAFSEPVVASSASAVPFQLLKDGNPLAGVFSMTGSQGSFVPKAALDPSATYQISISGLTDLSGNPLPAFTSSFTTAAANPPAGQLQVIGVVPASGAIADPGAPIVLTFNRTVNPVSAYSQSNVYFLRNSTSQFPIPGTFQVDGATLTFTPAVPLPGTAYIVNPGGLTDLAGAGMTYFSSTFSIPATANTLPPPTVISVAPGDGQPVLYQSPYVVFTFSGPLDPSTVTPTNFVAYGAKGLIAVKPTLLAGSIQVAVTFSADPGTLVTLYVNSGVADPAGNRAAPFRTTVRMSDSPASKGAYVALQRPGVYSSNNLPPNIGITLLFSAPVDRASVEQGLLVTANGAFVSGRVEWTPDSTGLTFLSSTPYAYSASISLAIVSPARDAAGNAVSYDARAYGATLQIATAPVAPASSLAVIGSSIPPAFGPSPLDSVIDLAFNQDIPAGVVHAAVGTLTDDTTGPTRNQVISCAVTLLQPRVLRFTPQSLLRPNDTYTFNFDSGGGLKWSNFIWTGTSATSNPYLAAFGPVGRSVPPNAQVTVAFSSRVAEFVMPEGLVLQSGGAAVPTRFTWNAADRALTLIPLALLHGDTDYTVVMTGFEDLAGHAIPDNTWTFHTSGDIDLQPPSILRMEPAGDAVSPNALVAVTFSEQVAADWIDRFALTDSGSNPANLTGSSSAVAGNLRLSDDQRTVFFTPDHPLPAGHNFSIIVPLAGDFSGNIPPGAWYTTTASSFRVGFAKTGAPVVIAATPDDAASNVPLNAQFQAQFDQPVLASSLDGVTFFESDVALPATVRLEADGRTVTAIPQRLPAAGSTCRFVVSGVRNTEGVVMAGQYQTTLAVGSTVDNSTPAQRSSPAGGQSEVPLNTVIHLRFSKPLNKLTVNPRNVVLTRLISNAIVDAAVSLLDSGHTIVVAPTVPLLQGTAYNLGLNGVTDLAGNSVNSSAYLSNSVNFTTASGVPTKPAVLVAVDPPDGSQNVPSSARPQLLFSQPVDLTLGENSVQLLSGDSVVPGILGGSGSLIVFAPARALADGQYRLQTSGITDVAGSPMAPVSSTFTVATAVVTPSPRLLSSTPASGAVGVPVTSTIALNFSRPMSAVSAAQLHVMWQGRQIPGAMLTQDSTVTFTPTVPLPGAATIYVSGPVADLAGLQASVNVQFTTGANADTTPPTVVFTYPPDGSRVPAYLTNIVLRFSKPVTANGPAPIQILVGASPLSGNGGLTLGEDGQTFSAGIYFPPDSEITVAVTADIQDFAGNSLQPFSYRFTTASDAESRGPKVTAVSPADGAVNVDANSPIELHFSQPMEPVSVSSGLQVTNTGRTVTGQVGHDDSAQILTFQPDVSYQPASTVELFAGQSIYAVSGERIAAFYSHFTTLGPSATGQAVSFSASANAIDIRFAGPVPGDVQQVYLRRGMSLVPARVAVASPDQIRVIPAAPLAENVLYHLVLDATREIAIQVEKETGDLSGEVAVLQIPGAVRIRFALPVNLLTVLRGGIRLLAADGAPVHFTVQAGLDRREVTLVPARSAGPLTVMLDGVESRSGRHLPTMLWRP